MSSTIDLMVSLEARLERLQNILIARATSSSWGGDYDAEATGDYELLRRELLTNDQVGKLLPPFVRSCRNLEQFWSYIKGQFAHYAERRQHIWDGFAPALAKLEGQAISPADVDISTALQSLSSEAVHEVWEKALRRRVEEPEGAITAARTLLETVCKHILTHLRVPYDEGADLPKLYGLTAQALQLAPDQHSEQVFKQILGGCKSVIDGLAGMRNKLGDAHGGGPGRVRPSARHAELAVNLAGATATFLVQTWKVRQPAV